ncbi:MAG: hypothetical protein COV59_04065 [Candidatus Magasanikbacteria bacterium CG11_big_fil_rev_8_21_14_0_20_39_34]|uniref:PDZ domain-containing protein n=1 Tax=Candidatus Magasanikbacteria bacterium CG11_big_fil_rev_8_21_14_0_20_39_34 TaxID=1974653 RepID=A0A2H0N4J4_9BACT|nr:MAG: hypothetical protein COV59_04065 [Candidatus Magasanikbacteria bacterium CG11_big_fil_rev_8_21_14_0_20_39_34]
MKTPPHLPRESCRIDTREKMRSFIWLCVLIFVAFLAGLSATLSVVAWVLPGYFNSNTPVQTSSLHPRTTFDENTYNALLHTIRQRTVRVYDIHHKQSEGVYNTEAFLGNAVLLSSDGWVAMRRTDGITSLGASSLEMVDHLGKVYKVSRVVRDPLKNIVYFKMATVQGDLFYVVSLAKPNALDVATWSLQDRQLVEAERISGTSSVASHFLWEKIPPDFTSEGLVGTLLFNSQGDFVGFVDNSGAVLSSYYISLALPNLLLNGRVDYFHIPVMGKVVEIATGVSSAQFGFVVTTPYEDLKKGDVIVSVNGRPYNPALFTLFDFVQEHSYTLSVRRGEEMTDINITTKLLSSHFEKNGV